MGRFQEVLNHNPRMSSRWTGFFVWALVAATTAFWGIKIFAATRPVPPGAQAPQVVAANGPMERLFGAVVVPATAENKPPPESSRFQLVGVIAPPAGSGQGGFALVSLDSQPARTWRVGATIDGNTSLLSVSKRGAEFGPQGGPSSFSLQLPEPASAETGTLQPAISQPDAAQMQMRQPQVPPQLQAQMPPQLQPQMQPQVQQTGVQPSMRGGFGRAASLTGRRGFQGPQGNNGIAPPKVGVPPDQQNQNDSGGVQQ
jgi:general secretion pathway protein C